jgi:hypothetical protein
MATIDSTLRLQQVAISEILGFCPCGYCIVNEADRVEHAKSHYRSYVTTYEEFFQVMEER